MQKTNLKASILIWSMFLSLVVSLSFVFVSTKINQNIAQNIYLDDFFSKENKTINLINSGSEGNIGNDELVKKEIIALSISSGESLNFSFSGTVSFTGSVHLKDGGPLYFETISYSGATSNLELTTSTGVIHNSTNQGFTGYLTNDYTNSDLILKNLGGFSTFYLELSKSYIGEGRISNFKIIKDIGGKEVEKLIIVN